MKKIDLIHKIEQGDPRVHATGFAQLYIEPNKRLPVWTDWLLLNATDISQIAFFHDHRYAIKSRILKGALHDQAVFPSADGDGTWKMYEVRPAHEGEAEKPCLIENKTYEVFVDPPRIIKAGEEYAIPRRAFHATRAIGDTVSIMEKIDEEKDWARLLVPDGNFDPIHSLLRQPDPVMVKREMIRAVALI